MTLPISPHGLSAAAAIGAAGLAARATAGVAKGSVEAIADFADVFAQTQPEKTTEPDQSAVTAPSLTNARQSLRAKITDLLRHFGISTDKPLAIGFSEGGDQVRIEAPGGSEELLSRLSDLQTSINADESLRSEIAASLRQLPNQTYLLDPTHLSP